LVDINKYIVSCVQCDWVGSIDRESVRERCLLYMYIDNSSQHRQYVNDL
jgi:hypothetical protein